MTDIFQIKYYLIYTVLSAIAVIIAFHIDFKKQLSTLVLSNKLLILFSIIFIFLFGLRSLNIGTDTYMYQHLFNTYKDFEFGTDFMMFFIFSFFHVLHLPFQSFLLFMSFLYIFILALSISKNSKIFSSNPLLIFFTFVSLFYFSTLGINIIRQGVSLSFFILFVINHQIDYRKKAMWLIPCLFAILFHFTTLIPIIIYILILFANRIKLIFYYSFYILSAILSFFNKGILDFQKYFFIVLIDERRSAYLTDESEIYEVGFKPQFLLFNTIFFVVFIYIKSFIIVDQYYLRLLKYFSTMSGIFFLTFQVPYSDRWGLMSWIVIPILLAPIFSIEMRRKLAILSIIFMVSIFIFFEIYK